MLKTLIDLFITLFKIGAVTFGGGIAMLPVLEKELVEKRNWTNTEELTDWFTIGQTTPGIIAVNVATFIGHKRAGTIGGIVGTFGMVAPSLIIITIIALFINNFADIIWVQKAMTGINVAVAAILTSSVYKFAKKNVKNIPGFILFVVAFVLIFVFNVNTVYVLIGSALSGIIITGCRGQLTENKAANGESK